jgi:hypothetical protein
VFILNAIRFGIKGFLHYHWSLFGYFGVFFASGVISPLGLRQLFAFQAILGEGMGQFSFLTKMGIDSHWLAAVG